MVVCTTSKTTTTRMLAVFAYLSIAMQCIAMMLASVRKACQHHFFEEGCQCDHMNSGRLYGQCWIWYDHLTTYPALSR